MRRGQPRRAPCAPAPAPAGCRACRSAGCVPRIAPCDLAMLGRSSYLSTTLSEKRYRTLRDRLEKPMIVLGIETTCDETAAAVVERVRRRAAARSCPTSCCRRSTSMPPSAAWCRRSPRAPMSRRSTASSPRRWRRPARPSTSIDGVAAAAGPGPDRRRHRRPDHRQGDRAGQRQAADRGQSSRSACAHRAADRRHAVSLLPVPRLRRPHPDRRGARRRRLRAARHHHRRRHRRGLRQDREAARPRLSRRPAGREGSGARRRRALRAAAADARAPGAGFLALRA